MTFSTATIQGKVMWIESDMNGGKEENRITTKMLVSVPDKRSRNEDGNYTRNNAYSVRIWDKQALSAAQYVEKFQTITIQGSITGVYQTKPSIKNGIEYPAQNVISLDFCNIIDYGTKQKDTRENTADVKTAKEITYSQSAKKAVNKK